MDCSFIVEEDDDNIEVIAEEGTYMNVKTEKAVEEYDDNDEVKFEFVDEDSCKDDKIEQTVEDDGDNDEVKFEFSDEDSYMKDEIEEDDDIVDLSESDDEVDSDDDEIQESVGGSKKRKLEDIESNSKQISKI